MNELNKFLFIIIVLFIYSFFIEPSRLVVKTQDIYLPNIDKRLDGIKIGVMSDMHIGTTFVNYKKAEKVISKMNSKNPDLVFLLGDLDAKSISKNYANKEITTLLNKLNAKYGVYSVLGNHDYAPVNIVRNILNNSDVTLLENESKYIKINGAMLRIAGFKDLWHSYINPDEILGDDDGVTTFVLAHNPDSFPYMPRFVSLTLSGHTHGGEVYFPLIGSFTVPSEFGDRYRKGHIVERGKHLFVSGGVATLSHLRFCNPPEIIILTIHPETEKTETKGISKHTRKNYIDTIHKGLVFIRSNM